MKKICKLVCVIGLFFIVFMSSNINLKGVFDMKKETTKGEFLNLGFIKESSNVVGYKEYLQGNTLMGECVVIENNKRILNSICEKLGVIILKKYYVDNTLIIEGVSNILPYKITGCQSNIQIAVKSGKITIGAPIIYGSY